MAELTLSSKVHGKPKFALLFKEFPAFYETKSFILVFITACHTILSCAHAFNPQPSILLDTLDKEWFSSLGVGWDGGTAPHINHQHITKCYTWPQSESFHAMHCPSLSHCFKNGSWAHLLSSHQYRGHFVEASHQNIMLTTHFHVLLTYRLYGRFSSINSISIHRTLSGHTTNFILNLSLTVESTHKGTKAIIPDSPVV